MEKQHPSDSELLHRLRTGDRLALEEIYTRYAPDLFRYLGARLDTREDCEEILVDVFIDLWENRSSLTDLKVHLHATTRFKVFEYVRDHPDSSIYQSLKHHYDENHEKKKNDSEGDFIKRD